MAGNTAAVAGNTAAVVAGSRNMEEDHLFDPSEEGRPAVPVRILEVDNPIDTFTPNNDRLHSIYYLLLHCLKREKEKARERDRERDNQKECCRT